MYAHWFSVFLRIENLSEKRLERNLLFGQLQIFRKNDTPTSVGF